MSYTAKHPAAFINALSEGPKREVIEWLQRTWDELCDAKARIAELEKQPHTDTIESHAVATRAEPTSAHSGGNGGIRCAGTATDMDRGNAAHGGVVADGPSIRTPVAGGNSDPSNAEQTHDSANRRSPAGQINRPPALDESNQQPNTDTAGAK